MKESIEDFRDLLRIKIISENSFDFGDFYDCSYFFELSEKKLFVNALRFSKHLENDDKSDGHLYQSIKEIIERLEKNGYAL